MHITEQLKWPKDRLIEQIEEDACHIETLYTIQQDYVHKLISGHQRRMRVDNLKFFRAGKLTLREFNASFLFC